MSVSRARLPADVHVGARLMVLRKRVRMSRSAFAEAAGMSFQQLLKYERGANRLSAGKLWHLSQILGVPVVEFFVGLPERGGMVGSSTPEHDALAQIVARPEGVAILETLPHLHPTLLAELAGLARVMVTRRMERPGAANDRETSIA